MLILSQSIVGAFMLALAWLTFRLDPLRPKLRPLLISSLLVVVSVLLSIVSATIPILGFPALRIGFSQLPLMLIGFWFGPSIALVSGLSADIIELLTGTISFPFLGFTLNKMLIALIPAMVKYAVVRGWINAQRLSYLLGALVYGGAIAYVWSVDQVQIGADLVRPELFERLALSAGLILLGLALMIALSKLFKARDVQVVAIWVLGALMVELIVQLTLTPIWLQVMFGLPILLSVSVRLIRIAFMVFINGVLGTFILRFIKP